MVMKSKKSKSKRVSLKKKYKVEKDPGIPNNWPFKEQELKALEARRTKAIEELEQKKAERKERLNE
ncbi:nuclear GTP-binding protein [Vigna unguiculata]|uniref:Nuclear GTP-binding protein n=1 Tax=Vigna unguiculata TaxID=3917 RepID=A0A4D6N9Q6_VIGUN|nr:nuclear GTP-binding protein [Vigna unguiculata]